MTPTPPDRPAHRRHHRGRRGAATPARAGRGRQRATNRTSTRGRVCAPRPATVWPFSDAEPLPGVGLLAGWLGRMIVTLVTGYTRPGDRVLLLPPPVPPRTLWGTRGGTRTVDPYAGLAEAVWTITRLGRSADTALTGPARHHEPGPTDPSGRSAPQSGAGPGLSSLVVHTSAESGIESDDRSRRPAARFDLVITAVHPHAVDWFVRTDWDPVLTPNGLLAVITHSDSRDGRLVDPVTAIATTIRSRQRGWLDHIVVLTQPLTAVDVAARPHSRTPRRGDRVALEPPPVRAVHHDLLLFGPVPSPVIMPTPADGASPSEGETSDD